jgi:hypothetical protein
LTCDFLGRVPLPEIPFLEIATMDLIEGKRFRHSAGFGKRIDFWIIGQLLKEGMDIYIPLVDDIGIDAVVRRKDGSFVEVQIKARSNDAKSVSAARFSVIKHELRENYWFVFHSERLKTTWIMSSNEFMAESNVNKGGKHAGLRSIVFNNGDRPRPRFKKYEATDFQRILKEKPADSPQRTL